jgi:plastocyanin
MRGYTTTVRRALAVSSAALLLVVAATVVALAQETHDVEVVDDAFEPPTIEVTEGDTVRWTQTGSNPHTVTADDESFDSHPDCQTFADAADGNCMEEGDTYDQTFEEEGEFGYYCRLHGSPGQGMAGTVVVTAAEVDPADDDPTDEDDDPVEEEEDDEELPETGPWGLIALLGALAVLGGGRAPRRRR